ncbi:MAG: magnesium-translocating P-type ATPase [Paracoccus sp. (in: a-proteobacteria)]|nr:magnesium-translocating P-type ATPase [Paracoccus sp. (in: a-proteobacteria)]
MPVTIPAPNAYWSRPSEAVLADLSATPAGLTAPEAARRLAADGPNSIAARDKATRLGTFIRQFRSSLVLILVFAAIVSAFVGDRNDALIIGTIILASCLLSFTQEWGASRTMEALTARISRKAVVLRDGVETQVSADTLVAGGVIRLSAGSLIPVDGLVLDAADLNVSEAALTGETYPVVKTPGLSAPDAPIARRDNVVFAGTSVRSGTATVLAVGTGARTEFATIAASLARRAPETDFARGIRRFGYLMTEITLVIVILVLSANLLLHRPLIDSLLFSLALAVGLTPELLPAIISVTLAQGARNMAASGVIVRRLDAIENLGSVNLLCTDKTGTVTEGVVRLDRCLDPAGNDSADVRSWAMLNAAHQAGMPNPLDEAIVAVGTVPEGWEKTAELPYDFQRKRLSVALRHPDQGDLLICKGAFQNVLDACSRVLEAGQDVPLDDARTRAITERMQGWSGEGFRVLGVAIRHLAADEKAQEADLTFAGFLLFLDPAKAGMTETLQALHDRGIAVKIVTGDNRYVAAHLARSVGLRADSILTGDDLSRMTKAALFARAPGTDLFAEIDPNQKERIIEALRGRGHVVGYMGDGINDAPALHEADVGISVDGAVDVAREAADMILLKQDLGVLARGIDDGRRTFANTMKYISITTSANFGNMISMAFASLMLPFLPLLAPQILLNNLLSSLPSLAIAHDRVDPESIAKPPRWNIGSIRRFMIYFGLVSSFFDFLTFGFLLLVMNAGADLFRTGWFVESLLTQLSIVLVVRTHKPFWQSRPSRLLAVLTGTVALIAIALPYSPLAAWFGFVPLPLPVLAGLLAITSAYLVVSELTKRFYFAQEDRRAAREGDAP